MIYPDKKLILYAMYFFPTKFQNSYLSHCKDKLSPVDKP
jgi:hypothetical protein